MASTSPFSPKRQCPYRPFNKAENTASSPSDVGLPGLLMLIIRGVYIKADGHFSSYQFTNTCVLDSILAAFHICYIKYPNVKSLLESNTSLGVIMNYLNSEKFDDAKALWLRQLRCLPKNKILDCRCHVQDHFPMFAKLVCAEVGYRQETPNGNPIYETTLSKFRALGDVKALGHANDPALILVHRVVQLNLPDLPKPPLCVKDDHQRIFELQFLLLGEGAHMLMCFNFSKNIWILYDDDPARRSFRHFKFEEELDCYMICLAGYVSTTRAEEHNHGVPETGAGAQPFESDSSRQQNISEESVDDVLMMLGDLSCGTSE